MLCFIWIIGSLSLKSPMREENKKLLLLLLLLLLFIYLFIYFWEFFVELIVGSLYSKGVSFLPEMKGLKLSSFLSVEAISWIKQHLDGITSNEQAIHLCQVSGFNLWLRAFAFFFIDSDTSVFSRTRSIGRNRMHGAIAGLKAPISIRILNLL